jgi:hypothetical protein
MLAAAIAVTAASFAPAMAAPSIGSPDGVAFRHFMHDLVAAAGARNEAAELKAAFRRHPQARRWLVEGDPDQLSREAGLDAGMGTVVQSALEPRGALGQMKGMLGRIPDNQFASALDRVHDAMWQDMAADINRSVQGIRMTRSSAVSMLIEPSGRIEVPGMRDMQWLVGGYFDHVALEDKRSMVVATLALPPTASTREQLAAVLHSAGPVAQKMFQLLGQDSRSDEVREVMQELKSRVRPFSDDIARRVVEEKLGVEVDRMFTSFTRVGSATTAQVYRAVLRSTGKVVAIKVLRPGIREKAARDMKTLRLLTPGAVQRDLVDTIGRKVDEELDLEYEARNIEDGKVYRRGRSIVVPERDRGFRSGKDVLVTRFIDGVTLDRPVAGPDDASRARALLRRGRALERLFGTLLGEALSSGVVHADLHGGNLIEMPGRGGKSRLAVVDWGSKVDLTRAERRGLVRLAAAVAEGSPHDAVEALDEISPLPPERKERLLRAVDPLVGKSDGVIAVIDVAIQNGLHLSEGLVGFSRSTKFVLEQVATVNRELDHLDPGKKLGRASVLRPAVKGGLRAAARDLLRTVAGAIPRPGRGAREPGVIFNRQTTGALWRIARKHGATLRVKAAEKARGLLKRKAGPQRAARR